MMMFSEILTSGFVALNETEFESREIHSQINEGFRGERESESRARWVTDRAATQLLITHFKCSRVLDLGWRRQEESRTGEKRAVRESQAAFSSWICTFMIDGVKLIKET